MALQVSYDAATDILTIWTGQPVATSAGLGDSLIADFGSDEGFDVVGFELRGAAEYLAPFFNPKGGEPEPLARKYQLAKRAD